MNPYRLCRTYQEKKRAYEPLPVSRTHPSVQKIMRCPECCRHFALLFYDSRRRMWLTACTKCGWLGPEAESIDEIVEALRTTAEMMELIDAL
jgi:hypothetical protein